MLSTVQVGKENDTGVEYSLEKGSGRKCLAAPGLLVAVLVQVMVCLCLCVCVSAGLYTVTPKSCHRFQMQYGFDT